MTAFDRAVSSPWAITEEGLRVVLDVAARENLSVEAVEANLGRPLNNTHAVSVSGSTAIIPIDGPIFPKANLMTQVSGATSIDSLRHDFSAALSDPSVQNIVFNIDSPGGAVTGVSEFADMIYAARGQKPITSYINGQGCSAAYWFASAADEIVLNDTAMAGSIGVLTAVPKNDEQSAKDVVFVASQSPNKRADPETDAGRSQIQTMVDDIAAVFVSTVARNRGVTDATVLTHFGAGGVMVGQKAVDAGLADRVGSLDAVLASLTQGAYGSMSTKNLAAVAENPQESDMESTNFVSGTLTLSPQMSSGQYIGTVTGVPLADNLATLMPTSVSADEVAALKAELAAANAERETLRAAAAIESARVATLERENTLRALAATATENEWFGDAQGHAAFLYDLTEAQREYFTTTMNALTAQVKAGELFKAVGSDNPTERAADPTVEFDHRAQVLAAKEGIDYATAAGIVAKSEPELYAAHLDQSRSTSR